MPSVEKVRQLVEAYKEFSKLNVWDIGWNLDQLVASYDLLMSRFAPFKVGDRVALAKTPNITQESAPGWMHSKHFLVKGAEGTVVEASCGTQGFSFIVSFDNESWIDPGYSGTDKGKLHFVEPGKRHGYHFREESLVLLDQYVPKTPIEEIESGLRSVICQLSKEVITGQLNKG